jgi:hypothetical protein
LKFHSLESNSISNSFIFIGRKKSVWLLDFISYTQIALQINLLNSLKVINQEIIFWKSINFLKHFWSILELGITNNLMHSINFQLTLIKKIEWKHKEIKTHLKVGQTFKLQQFYYYSILLCGQRHSVLSILSDL